MGNMMNKIVAAFIVFLMFIPQAMAQGNQKADPRLVDFYIKKREALLAKGDAYLVELSAAIGVTIGEAIKLRTENKPREGLAKLQELSRFDSIDEIPSPFLQYLLSDFYGKTGDQKTAAKHFSMSLAVIDVFTKHMGSGLNPDDPLNIIMLNDLREWGRLQNGAIIEPTPFLHNGKKLLKAKFTEVKTGESKAIFYVKQEETKKSTQADFRLFEPVPLAQMVPETRKNMEIAREKRDMFLADNSFPYLKLLASLAEKRSAALDLMVKGKLQEAIAKLEELEEFRPIKEIPTPELLSFYSSLQSRVGNQQKHKEIRGLLIGVNQAIAHSGDALSPETAVHVIFTSEEYLWLQDNRLKMIKQAVIEKNGQKYDVMTAADADGKQRDYYFNITRLFKKYSQHLPK
jgi:hypothetical protein